MPFCTIEAEYRLKFGALREHGLLDVKSSVWQFSRIVRRRHPGRETVVDPLSFLGTAYYKVTALQVDYPLPTCH